MRSRASEREGASSVTSLTARMPLQCLGELSDEGPFLGLGGLAQSEGKGGFDLRGRVQLPPFAPLALPRPVRPSQGLRRVYPRDRCKRPHGSVDIPSGADARVPRASALKRADRWLHPDGHGVRTSAIDARVPAHPRRMNGERTPRPWNRRVERGGSMPASPGDRGAWKRDRCRITQVRACYERGRCTDRRRQMRASTRHGPGLRWRDRRLRRRPPDVRSGREAHGEP